ncbi:MAG: helix-hairpin-helix domain-containing protein [Gammaproteobacteria bacterium]|nr:helix-hairpin-helix domain-containing protein [Gammaproteobacteria bacterium]
MKNTEIAGQLNEIADLLQEQNANPFRVNAYRHAASTLENLQQPVTEVIEQRGFEGLLELPGIGEGIARSIYEFVATGRMSRLESLRAGHDTVLLFEQIPGVGPKLAHQILETLHIETLEALELAAHNGRLETVPGFSHKKVSMVQAWLAQVLGKRRPVTQEEGRAAEPPVSLLLQIDRQYRDKADADELLKIAPKRFNPKGESWLPVMHATKKEWHFTALYSNTARAHQLNQTKDWVVIYFYDKEHHEGQHTVVTETRGTLVGKRVVRGRESECQDHYFHNVG